MSESGSGRKHHCYLPFKAYISVTAVFNILKSPFEFQETLNLSLLLGHCSIQFLLYPTSIGIANKGLVAENKENTKMMVDSVTVGKDEFVCTKETHLTVSKSSLFFAGDGFSAYNCKGELVFRVDTYGPDIRDTAELVLMDAHGRCLLTVRRKVLLFPFMGTKFCEENGHSSPPLLIFNLFLGLIGICVVCRRDRACISGGRGFSGKGRMGRSRSSAFGGRRSSGGRT